jgi:hypothetical protein
LLSRGVTVLLLMMAFSVLFVPRVSSQNTSQYLSSATSYLTAAPSPSQYVTVIATYCATCSYGCPLMLLVSGVYVTLYNLRGYNLALINSVGLIAVTGFWVQMSTTQNPHWTSPMCSLNGFYVVSWTSASLNSP